MRTLSLLRAPRWCALLAATLSMACVHTRVTGYGAPGAPEPRTPADQIRFYDTQRPTCAYMELGHVTSQPRFLASWSSVVRKARERAHEMGGDAIVAVRESTRISGAVINKESVSTTEQTSISGTVIRFTDPECRE